MHPIARPSASASPSAPFNGSAEHALLARRATFGYTAEVAEEIDLLGGDVWVSRQLDPMSIPDGDLDAKLATFPWMTASASQIINDPTLNTVVLGTTFKGIQLMRAVESKRQLLERTVAFWRNHFNVTIGRYFRFVEDPSLWRAHALGNFGDMLRGISTSASMIAYLDNQLNVAGAVNENLAREILELHTLGVDGPYTETDVREFTRVLTGWTYDDVRTNPTFGTALFDPAQHDTGSKVVLGVTFDGTQGQDELLIMLDVLANHPSTISFVVGKLAVYFLGENPPATVISRAESEWGTTGGDLAAVIGTLLSSASLTTVVATGTTKFSRPFEWLASIYRCTGVELPDPADTREIMATLGQAPYEWGPPDGYPFDRVRWNGFLQPRWRFAADFGRPGLALWNHTVNDLLALVQGIPRTGWVNELDIVLTGGRLSAVDLAEISTHVSMLPSFFDVEVIGETLELIFSCPSYQAI